MSDIRYRDLAGFVDRLATAADQRTTPRRAATALLTASALTAASVMVLTDLPPPLLESRWMVAKAATTPTAAPPMVWEPPQARAVAPQTPFPEATPTDGDKPPQPTGDFVGWSVLDLRTGAITGSDNHAETSTTASMIKAWLVADYLHRGTDANRSPSPERLQQLQAIVRDSDNHYAELLYHELGADESIERLISRCELTDSYPIPGRWSNTQLSPRDTARMAACIADGRAAGKQWTDWLLTEMRAVHGVGDFGIRHAFSSNYQSSIAIKNGWVVRSDEAAWHVNCLAIGDDWTMSVITRYPVELGQEHGAELCRSLAAQHLPLPEQPPQE